jgi:arsenite methyltransferase
MRKELAVTALDTNLLEVKVKDMYREVAQNPHGVFHFEMGRAVAERLGYPVDRLRRIHPRAVESFAGVGYFFGLADLRPGERVVDLGSGSGMDAFLASTLVGPSGSVLGVDFTPEQVEKARRLAVEAGIDNIEFREGRIEDLPVADDSFDCVISNGVINLSPDKERVFAEAARVLRSGGRMAIADIVSETQLTEAIVCDADLWAACIGGATQQDTYRAAIEAAGLSVTDVRVNPYEFISARAKNATAKYGVKSISLLAFSLHE